MKGLAKILLSVYLLFLGFSIRAEEGMLIPSLIAAFESDMRAKGMKLSAEDIYSVNKSSIKDAILHFGGGCTAELVSNKGLLLTNHHCGYSQIQSHSSLEKDYLKNGFWAKTLADELPNPGLTATRIVRIEDVTAAIFAGGVTKDNKTAIQLAIQKLVEAAVKGTNYEAEIKPFNFGNDYYMLVKETFKDVRLVGTPPNSIGKFGGDTDNWVWPRHTGDFSVFRVYAGKDNKPANFSKDNVPYQPLHFLPISFKDRKAGDFTMVYGFPGVTEQHVVSGYLKFIVEKERPARIKMRDLSLSVINDGMKNSDMIRIQYAAKQASIANAWKKWIGQIQGLKELNGYYKKLDYEKRYKERALSKPEWKKYSDIVEKMNQLVEKSVQHEFEYAMGVEYLSVGPEYFRLARSFNDVLTNYTTLKANNTLAASLEKLKSGAESFFKNYDEKVDRGIFELQTVEYFKQVGWNEKIALEVYTKTLTESIYKQSIFTNKERYLKAINSLNEKTIKKLSKDQGLLHYTKILDKFRLEVLPKYQTFQTEMTGLLQVYVEGKYVMFPEDKHWPDANSTLRITYGQLEGSCPVDGMCYTEHTTLDGIIAKYNTGNADFELLPRMLELHADQNYGPYAQNGKLWVCFTGSNHTTGGNSGSPVLDENGHLMGLNFDRSWESTMSDYLFDSSRCRNIVVDIRYVLWVMDIYSDARHLVDEMVLVKE
jgi:hypothetical protein